MINSVKINLSALSTIKKGAVIYLSAEVDTDEGYNLVWNTSNPKIATVDESGTLRALKSGTITVTATALTAYGLSAKSVAVVKVV